MGFEFIPKNYPTHPGVYLMKNPKGEILYVGKAGSLRKRLTSYFNGSPAKRGDQKTMILVTKVHDIETIVVNNEMEALVLENELIKKYMPQFNVLMRDDKNYLYVKITMNEDFPRIMFARGAANDGAKYFGPYTQTGYIYETMRLIKKIFPLCSETKQITAESLEKTKKKRACLNYHLGVCPGVCLGKVTPAEYHQTMEQVIDFLNGKYEKVHQELGEQMKQLSADKKFERAAKLRDTLFAIEKLSDKQQVLSSDTKLIEDAVGIARQLNKAQITIMQIRYGKLLGQQTIVFETKYETSDEELLTSFVRQYYEKATLVPKNILLPMSLPDSKLLERWLSGLAGHKVALAAPTKGRTGALVSIANKNAALAFDLLASKLQIQEKGSAEGVAQLKDILRLPKLDRIEAYDISNTQGADAVGSLVVFEDGKMAKKQYRRFKIKSVQGPNDFASLAEVLERRFQHEEGDEKFAKLPDLVLIDGGKGQVNTVAKTLENHSVRIIGLAKGQALVDRQGKLVKASSHSQHAFDDIVLPFTKDPLILASNAPAKFLLQRIRDEAHRFAISYHHALRSKKLRESVLEKIPGVGPGTRHKLIKAFGSIRALKDLSEEQIAEVVGKNIAHKVKQGI